MIDPNSPLIPRKVLFGNPARAGVQISPDGAWLAWLAPVDNVLNIHLAPADDLDAPKPITHDTHRGIQSFSWARNKTHLLYGQDENGTENWHIYAVDLATGTTRDLTPLENVHAMIQGLSWEHPDQIVIGINDRDPAWHDLYLVDITTGARELMFENTNNMAAFTLDRSLELRLATQTQPEGGRKIFRFTEGAVTEFKTISHEDDLTTRPFGFTSDGTHFHMLTSQGRDTAAFVSVNWETGNETDIASHPHADMTTAIFDPQTYEILAAGTVYQKLTWEPIGDTVKDDLEFLHAELDGEISVSSQTEDNQSWTIAATSSIQPAVYYRFDRADRKLTRLFSSKPDLDAYDLTKLEPTIIKTRDGLEMVSYLTRAKTDEPTPLVLVVHGGPWARDTYGFDPTHLWLADRGYAALSVNFRGSFGFGKSFLNAGDLEWGRKMHHDLLDAVDWAIAQGVTTADQVAIYGGSYGGYAALAGLTFTPDVFACAVDVVGPSNLETLLETIPPYWKTFYENLARRVGDPRTDDGMALLKERSPLTHVDKISKPLLIVQGANDPRVKQAESDQIANAMTAKGLPVTYVLYPDEGHGLVRPENRMSFTAISEAFFAQHLGGSFEPIGTDFDGSTHTFKAGEDELQIVTIA